MSPRRRRTYNKRWNNAQEHTKAVGARKAMNAAKHERTTDVGGGSGGGGGEHGSPAILAATRFFAGHSRQAD
jgi:hypothetical protein